MDSRLKAKQGGWRSETMDYSVRHETGARVRATKTAGTRRKTDREKRDTELVYVVEVEDRTRAQHAGRPDVYM